MTSDDEDHVSLPRRSLQRIHDRNKELDQRANDAELKYEEAMQKIKYLLEKIGGKQ